MKNIDKKLWGIFLIVVYLWLKNGDLSSLLFFKAGYFETDALILNNITNILNGLLQLLPIVGVVLFLSSAFNKSKSA